MARTPQEILERSFSHVEAAEGGNLVVPASDAAEREAWGAHATVTALYRVGLLSQDESAEWTDRINKIVLSDGE